jgi:MraZ protein
VGENGQSFHGEFYPQLDEKGRIKLPARLLTTLLDNFGRKCRMMRMPEKCLAIYPGRTWEAGWKQVISRLGPLVPGSSDARALTRIAGTGLDVEVAAQGRLLLPDSYRRHIEVSPGDSVAVIGAEDRIEIWKQENWERYFGEQMSHYEEIAERTVSRISGDHHAAENEQ